LSVGALSKGRLVLHVKGTTTEIARAFAASVETVRRSNGILSAQLATKARFRRRSPSTSPALRDSLRWCSLRRTRFSPRQFTHRDRLDVSGRWRRDLDDAEHQRRLHAISVRPALRTRVVVGEQRDRHGPDDRRVRTERVRPGRPRDVPELLRTQPHDHARLGRRRTDRGLRRRTDPRHRRGRGDGARRDDRDLPGTEQQLRTNRCVPADRRRRHRVDRLHVVGTCESDPSGDPAAEQPIFEQMAAQGQTVVSAAGDSGSSDCNGITNNNPAVDDPASQPYVTGVGGLSVGDINPLNESVWNTP